MAMSSSSPTDPPAPPSAPVPSTRLFTTTPQRPPNPPPLSQPYFHHSSMYPSHHHQQRQPQPVLNLSSRVSTNSIHPRLAKPNDASQGILYPVASSGRGFFPKSVRPQFADQAVKIANPVAFQPRPMVSAGYPHPIRPFGFSRSDPQGQPLHLIGPTHLQHTLFGSTGAIASGLVQNVLASANTKVAPSSPSVPECNGNKDIRTRSRDDDYVTVRGRKVRICDGSSLYSICRSWLRNSIIPEESQPQYMDDIRSLPRPLPIPVADAHSPTKKEVVKEEEEENVDDLSTEELLKRHIKRGKKVRARLREERLQRIARYKTRLALLLPPLGDQQFRNDTIAGNMRMPL